MYVAIVLNRGAKGNKNKPVIVYSSFAETAEECAAAQLANARNYITSYPINELEVLVGELTMRAEYPKPPVDLIALKGY